MHFPGLFDHIHACHGDAAGQWGFKPGNAAHKRCLASAVGPDQGGNAAARNRERYIIEGAMTGVFESQSGNFYQGNLNII
jgi:hypothetical protein